MVSLQHQTVVGGSRCSMLANRNSSNILDIHSDVQDTIIHKK